MKPPRSRKSKLIASIQKLCPFPVITSPKLTTTLAPFIIDWFCLIWILRKWSHMYVLLSSWLLLLNIVSVSFIMLLLTAVANSFYSIQYLIAWLYYNLLFILLFVDIWFISSFGSYECSSICLLVLYLGYIPGSGNVWSYVQFS